MIFLKLLVAGHMTIFLTRTERNFWERPFPSLRLVIPLELTQVVGTLIAVYGFLVSPVGWVDAGIVWGYAAVWFLILNWLKPIGYKIQHAVESA